MFEKVITSKPFPAFVLIQDENTSKALNLFKGILKSDTEDENVKVIHLICTGNPPAFYLKSFESKKVLTYDLFMDPCCWIKNSNYDCDTVFTKILSSQELKSTVMIDSVTTVNILKNFSYMCNIIHKLKERCMRVVCLAQGDVINNKDLLKKICFLSSVSLKVHLNFSRSITNYSDKSCLAIEGMYKKSNSKVVMIKELYKIDGEYNIQSEMYDDRKQVYVSNNVTPDMIGLTTFRMGLHINENEKRARDNLILPYLRAANKKNECEDEKTKGEIVYYAESGDELEEDPDDDLDI